MKSDQGRGSDEERAYVMRRCKDSKMSLWNFRGAERKLGRAGQNAAVFERGGVRSLRLGSSFHFCLARPAESPERQNGDRTTLLRVSPTLALTSCSALVFLKNQFQKKGNRRAAAPKTRASRSASLVASVGCAPPNQTVVSAKVTQHGLFSHSRSRLCFEPAL